MKAPNMIGWSLRDAMKVASIAKLQLNTAGTGYVTKQNIKSGKIMKEGDFFIVELTEPRKINTNKKTNKDEQYD